MQARHQECKPSGVPAFRPKNSSSKGHNSPQRGQRFSTPNSVNSLVGTYGLTAPLVTNQAAQTNSRITRRSPQGHTNAVSSGSGSQTSGWQSRQSRSEQGLSFTADLRAVAQRP